MLKRAFDIGFASAVLLLSLPVLIPLTVVVFLNDFHNPIYFAPRVGKDGKSFIMVKLRSMVYGADKNHVDSTSSTDARITPVGHFIRKYKIDEMLQMLNVIKGDMSVVGPRPNVKRETSLYTDTELNLLSVRPGITDIASIVFADEAQILQGKLDPDISYNQLIRPCKSRLGLVYIYNQKFTLDIQLIFLTLLAVLNRQQALKRVQKLLVDMEVDAETIQIASRQTPLRPMPPPGAVSIVNSRAE